MKVTSLVTMLGCLGVAAVAQAGTVSINFQQNGTGDLGAGAKTFTQDGVSLTAQGFSASGGVDLWAKTSGDPTETGLGLANDPNDHEILPGSFVQLTVPPSGVSGAILTLIMTGSIQSGEIVDVRFGNTSGTLGTTVIGTQTGGGTASFTIPSGTGFVDVTSDAGNVLLDAAVITTPNVPDGGTTIVLLGGAITALGLIRRKLMA
jgi:hypothetical protein